MVKPVTVRLVLSIDVSQKWSIRQLDINNAFLQGTLTDDVYVIQPPGFIDPIYPSHVCKLKKALYSLKLAPRAWYIEFTTHLLAAGFRNTVSDTSLFVLMIKRLLFISWCTLMILLLQATMTVPCIASLYLLQTDSLSRTLVHSPIF